MLTIIVVSSCKTVSPGEVGFIVHRGVIKPGVLNSGRYHFNIFTSRILTFNTRITEFSTTMSPPTKEQEMMGYLAGRAGKLSPPR